MIQLFKALSTAANSYRTPSFAASFYEQEMSQNDTTQRAQAAPKKSGEHHD